MNGGTVTGWVIGGGSDPGSTVQSTVVAINSGATVPNVYGGGANGNVTGSTSVTIAGTVSQNAYGGAAGSGTVGSTNVTIQNGGKVHGVLGGSGSGGTVGSTNVIINGGAISDVIRGSTNGSVSGNTSVTIRGGSVGSIYGGGYGNGASCANSTITITGGEINHVILAGDSSISGNGTITISGGTIESYVRCGNVTGTKTINLSGNPKIGNKAKVGVELSSTTTKLATITGMLTGAAGDNITLVPATGAAVGTTVATVSNTANADASKFTMEGWVLKTSLNTIVIGSALPTVDTALKTVCGNGTPLLITGTSDSSTTRCLNVVACSHIPVRTRNRVFVRCLTFSR